MRYQCSKKYRFQGHGLWVLCGMVLLLGLLSSDATSVAHAADCSTAANVTTCTPANGQLLFDDVKVEKFEASPAAVPSSGLLSPGGVVALLGITILLILDWTLNRRRY
jgi:hypothetical protein